MIIRIVPPLLPSKKLLAVAGGLALRVEDHLARRTQGLDVGVDTGQVVDLILEPAVEGGLDAAYSCLTLGSSPVRDNDHQGTVRSSWVRPTLVGDSKL